MNYNQGLLRRKENFDQGQNRHDNTVQI